jgi:hypothetical protein
MNKPNLSSPAINGTGHLHSNGGLRIGQALLNPVWLNRLGHVPDKQEIHWMKYLLLPLLLYRPWSHLSSGTDQILDAPVSHSLSSSFCFIVLESVG